MKSNTYSDLDDSAENESNVMPLAALGKRIFLVAEMYKNRKSAADAAGISTDQLSRYMRGENQPGLLAMASLLKPHGISLDWLASGEGDMKGHDTDIDLLTLVTKTIDQALLENQIEISVDKKSRLIALLYSLHGEGNHESINMDNVIRLIDYGR